MRGAERPQERHGAAVLAFPRPAARERPERTTDGLWRYLLGLPTEHDAQLYRRLAVAAAEEHR